MGVAGRKGWKEELEIGRRYSDLSNDYFKVLKKMMKSKEVADQKWAVQELSKAFVKMIPQDVTSGGQPLVLQMDNAFVSSSEKKRK